MEAARREEYEKSKRILSKLLKSKDLQMRTNALEALAKVLHRAGERNRAYKLLLKADAKYLREGKCLLCRLAFERGDFSVIEKYAREIYEIESTVQTALLNARAFATMKKWDMARGWLKTVSRFDEVEMEAVLEEGCFEEIREESLV